MQRINVEGTQRLLDTAAAKGVARVVVASSALAVGVNRRPQALDETASWAEHAFDLPYAIDAPAGRTGGARQGQARVRRCRGLPGIYVGTRRSRRRPCEQAAQDAHQRQAALYAAGGRLAVWMCGTLRTARYWPPSAGIPGQRYLISGHNVTTSQLLEQAAAIAGVRAPRFAPPRVLLSVSSARVEIVSNAQGKTTSGDPGCPADHRALRVVRHVASARRPRMGAATAPADPRGHDSLAAGSAMSLKNPRDPRGVDRCI